MALRLNTNIPSIRAHLNLALNDRAMGLSLERLSSGLRINRSADDPYGLSVSDIMTSEFTGLDMANRNAQDGVSMLQTADGGLEQTDYILQRMRELAVEAGNSTLTPNDRASVQLELSQLASEIDRVASTVDFNDTKLLNGSAPLVTLQIGADSFQSLVVRLVPSDLAHLSLGNLDVSSPTLASNLIAKLDDALTVVNDARSGYGAAIYRLESTMGNLTTMSTNLQTGRSRVRDLDMASEVVNLSRGQILSQASTSMLAQANQFPTAVLALIKGG